MNGSRPHSDPSPRPATPIDVLWRPRAIASAIVMGQALALIVTLAHPMAVDRWVRFGLASLACQWVLLLTLSQLWLVRRQLAGVAPIAIGWTGVLLLGLNTGFATGAAYLVLGETGAPVGGWANFLMRATAIALAAGLITQFCFVAFWRQHTLAMQLAAADLATLQARVHPHFLFNTLNTAIALCRERPRDAEDVLMSLSELFRGSLSATRSHPLSKEWEIVRHYLDIESKRLQDRLDVGWDIADGLPDIEVPPLIVQALVENAVHHGVEPIRRGGRIVIRGVLREGRMVLGVENAVADGATNGRRGHGIGLAAGRAGLQLLYGDSARLTKRLEDGRFIVEVELPLHATTR